MPFNSLSFLFFLPAVFLAFHVTPDRSRWQVLLIASLLFYSSLGVPHLLIVLLLVTVVSYVIGKCLATAREPGKKRWLLWVGVGANVAILLAAKLLPFASLPLASNSFLHTLLVSIGVSYFVFQAISYLIDIYLEIGEVESHFGLFFLYMAFFPKLLQGPIERSGDLLPQLHRPLRCRYEDYRAGILLFGWGLFKKVVIADRLALFVDTVYGDVYSFTGLPLLVATYFYALQIFFDFSGYTDMALGVGRLFGLRLTQNFNAPYAATSVADFWRRWHISFSRWILDYIFKPLQMRWRDLRNVGTAAALMVTFLVSGLWHGISWGFVVWGGLHGLYLASSVFYRPLQRRIHKALRLDKTAVLRVWQMLVTFHMVCLAWVFFRATSLADGLYLIGHLFDGLAGQLALLGDKEMVRQMLYLGQGSHEFIVAIVTVIAGFALPAVGRRLDFFRRPLVFRWAMYYSFVGLVLYLGVFESSGRFIYFQF
jgi:D-alanyl-lipoteichoic acid acyltransferase DltB (MBOAT superfamily)